MSYLKKGMHPNWRIIDEYPCIVCATSIFRVRRTQQFCTTKCRLKYYKKHKVAEYQRNQTLRKYGLTQEQYDTKMLEQQNCCGICGVRIGIAAADANIDHNHVTGAVRGILCRLCNLGIGALKDDLRIVLRAAEYLAHYDMINLE